MGVESFLYHVIREYASVITSLSLTPVPLSLMLLDSRSHFLPGHLFLYPLITTILVHKCIFNPRVINGSNNKTFIHFLLPTSTECKEVNTNFEKYDKLAFHKVKQKIKCVFINSIYLENGHKFILQSFPFDWVYLYLM